MKKPWIFLSNTFETSTRGSFSKAMKVSNFTDAALFAAILNPLILILYNFYHPLHLAFKAAYDQWKAQSDMQQGLTTAFTNLLNGLAQKVNDWDFEIQKTYRDYTDEYKAIFTHAHSPFITGSQSSRISAVNSFALVLANYPLLDPVRLDVVAYHTLLDNANTAQKGSKSTTKNLSITVEAERINMTDGLEYAYGGLVQIYYKSMDTIKDYFDVESLQQKRQKTFKKHLAPTQVYTLAKRSLKTTDTLLGTNNSDATILIYVASEKDFANPTTFFALPPRVTNVIINAPALGDVATGKYIIVKNTDINLEGDIEITL